MHTALVPVAVVASFSAAWLIFAVQPMTARMVLPRLGGSAAVWNTALVFFQLGLLGGYALTHFTTTRLAPRAQVVVHLGLVALAALFLPIDVASRWAPPTTGNPSLWLIGVLSITVGLPYLALSAISPLVQRWFSLSDHPRAADPYFLYAASNAGSLLGLLTYPLLVEPRWSLGQQARGWTLGYVLFAVAIVTLVAIVRPARRAVVFEVADFDKPSPSWKQRATWIAWAFLPSSLMLGVTTHITTDIASLPLFWVIPLAIYLATYIIAFGARRLAMTVIDVSFLGCAAATAVAFLWLPDKRMSIALTLAMLASAGLAFHGRLAQSRPASQYLTGFFLCTAFGGVLGGAFNALIAPLLFHQVLEYGLVVAAAALVVTVWSPPRPSFSVRNAVPIIVIAALAFAAGGSNFTVLVLGLLVLTVLALRVRPLIAGIAIAAVIAAGLGVDATHVLHADRSFYGAFEVDQEAGFRSLLHGTTVHGGQLLDPARRDTPVAYYTRSGPIGHVFSAYGDDLDHVAVIGLGVGGLAAYSTPSRSMTFFEIDEKIRDVANRYFTYLADAKGPTDVVLGDGRLELARRRDRFSAVIFDAFNSDSIPVHLVTREAISMYLDHLEPHGLLIMNISNRYVGLAPVIAATAEKMHLSTLRWRDLEITPAERRLHKKRSDWVVLARDRADLAPLLADSRWQPARSESAVHSWSDDYSDIISVLHF
jgi:hypothetical protein